MKHKLFKMLLRSCVACIVMPAVWQTGEALAVEAIVIRPATVEVIEQRTIAAADAGLVANVLFSEGQKVAAGSQVASLESMEQEILVRAAEVNLEAAKLTHAEQHGLATAKNALGEVTAAMDRIQVSLEMARRQAADSSLVAIANAEHAAASTELKRAQDSRKRYHASVSDSEFLKLQTAFTTATSKLEKAESDNAVADFQPKLHEAELIEQQATILKFKSLMNQEEANIRLNALTVTSREQELNRANVLLDRRKMHSPIGGVVAEVFKKPGEWVEKGTPIMRVINLDELRVEGFISISEITDDLIGRDAEVEFLSMQGENRYRGVVTHILPDVDRVNQYAPIWIRFLSPQNKVYPGVVGEVRILETRETVSASSAKAD